MLAYIVLKVAVGKATKEEVAPGWSTAFCSIWDSFKHRIKQVKTILAYINKLDNDNICQGSDSNNQFNWSPLFYPAPVTFFRLGPVSYH